MRIGKAFSGIALISGLLSFGVPAAAHPPADDVEQLAHAGRLLTDDRLTLMPFIGPGFRAIYDHRFEIEKDMSDVRAQVIGTVAIPFAEVSANVDARFFLMTFGGSVGYHNEWHNLQFNPDPQTGRDRAGEPRFQIDPTVPGLEKDPKPGFNDLNGPARALKDQNSDVTVKRWAFEELRWGFAWPAYNFTGSSTLSFRHENRPDVSYDWEQGTVLNGGWNVRWEGYFFFRSRNIGFIGPALRAMVVPRNRTRGDATLGGVFLPSDSACQPGVVTSGSLTCVGTHEFEFHYGLIAGLRPNWVNSTDLLLFRGYTTYGLNNALFGTQAFRQPIQLLFAYMVDFDL